MDDYDSPEPNNNNGKVPLSTVFMSIGGIILISMCVIWLVAPITMPQFLYDRLTAVLPEEVAITLPTPASVAIVPTRTPTAPPLLPESPLDQVPVTAVTITPEANRQHNVPSRLVIPEIELDAPISAIGLAAIEYEGETYYQWQVPNDFVAGWHNDSAPLGQTGNTILNGHHNVYGEVFRNLIYLEEGDNIIIYDDEKEHDYEVVEKVVVAERGQPLEVRLENARWIQPTNDERITLLTCWPYDDNSHRLIIVAKPIKEERGLRIED